MPHKNPIAKKNYFTKYYQEHKSKMIENATNLYHSDNIKCEYCNRDYSKVFYPKHIATEKHIRNSQSEEKPEKE